jgi:oxepin-CoA hydrolase/3-oxo-5,6-dehydrosuberyl-CoA semialdehyde dehydrogenase
MTAIPFDVNDSRIRETLLRRTVVDALSKLREDTTPRWGKMTAQQMVEHLLWACELSTGRAQTDCPIPEAQREKIKAFLHDDRPTPREFANPVLAAGLPPLRYGSLLEAAAALAAETDRFFAQADTTPQVRHMHPVFGPIGIEEWARAHFKHVYHHLLQFGLIAAESQEPRAEN